MSRPARIECSLGRRPLPCEAAANKTCVGATAFWRCSDDEGASARGHRSGRDALLHDRHEGTLE